MRRSRARQSRTTRERAQHRKNLRWSILVGRFIAVFGGFLNGGIILFFIVNEIFFT